MKSLEKFVKEKNPALFEEYKQYQAAEKKKATEKEQKKREKIRKQRKFWEFGFTYSVLHSYKGWTSSECDECMPFKFAFNLFSDDELGRYLKIVTPTDLGYAEAETFESILEYAGVNERDLKREFEKFLYKSNYLSLKRYTDNRYDWECKVNSEIEWSGSYIWDKSYFDEIWNDFKTLHFEEGEEDDNF